MVKKINTKKTTKKPVVAKKRISKNKKEVMSILNPKRRIGVAFLTFIATCLLCISLYSGYSTISIANTDKNKVLGMTTVQRRAAINTYARSFAWDYKVSDGTTSISQAKPAYQNAKPSSATDCSVFVYEVMVHSGADINFPPSGATQQLNYAKSAVYPASAGTTLAGTKVYTVLTGISSDYKASYVNGVYQKNKVSLTPGDLMFIPGLHAFIYTGQVASGSKYYGVEASNNTRVPNAANAGWWISNYSSITAIRVR